MGARFRGTVSPSDHRRTAASCRETLTPDISEHRVNFRPENPEEFRERSNESISGLVKQIVAIADVLKKELPFDSLAPSWHVEDGTDEVTVGILARWEDRHSCVMIYTHSLDQPPQPQEIFPAESCAVGTLQAFSPDASPREVAEVCGTPDRWMVHHNGRWVPLSASYVAFLMGLSYKHRDVT